MKKLNWKEIGRFVAVLVQLVSIVIKAFKDMKVGPEIIDWLVGSGKDSLVGKLKELTVEFVKANPPEVPKSAEAPVLRAEIDTDKDPRLPFTGAVIEKHVKQGRMTIEHRGDELFVNDKKVVLHRVSRQMNGGQLTGYELREELSGKLVLNACVLDFLLERTDFIPDSWKKDGAGNTIRIFFWGTVYRSPSNGYLCVRFLYWFDFRWCENYYWLDNDWDDDSPAAMLEV